MNRQFQILIVEDDETWQEMLKDTVSDLNSTIEIVGDSKDALSLIQSIPFHLIILDLSLIKDDATNEDGMSLSSQIFESGLFNATKVIMISAFATTQRMRQAFGKYKVVDFIPKEDFTVKDFQSLVQRVLEEEVRINLNLEIHWAEGLTNISQVITNLLIDGKRISKNSPLQAPLAEDLEDLLCRLFYKDKRILVKPLTPGKSGSAVVLVTPYSQYGAEQPVVVKFGNYKDIEQEEHNFKQFVEQFLGNSRHTNVRDLRRSLRLGGIIYSLVGGASDKFKSFRDFYAAEPPEQIRLILQKLIYETCGNWYANKGNLELVDLAEEYKKQLRFSWDLIEKAVSDLKQVTGQETLSFKMLSDNRQFANPISLMKERCFLISTYLCITHGDLNPDNILLDGAGHSWLIDFGRTGFGHFLRDIAELDICIRFQLLRDTEANLNERLQLEEALNQLFNFSEVKNLSEEFVTDNNALSKAYQTVKELRSLAYQMMRPYPEDEMKEYYLALIYYSINFVKFYNLESIYREHALLSACLLVNKL